MLESQYRRRDPRVFIGDLGSYMAAFKDSEVEKKSQAALKAFGASSWAQVSTDNDRRAETRAIPVIQQRFANIGREVPKTVQNAIKTLNERK